MAADKHIVSYTLDLKGAQTACHRKFLRKIANPPDSPDRASPATSTMEGGGNYLCHKLCGMPDQPDTQHYQGKMHPGIFSIMMLLITVTKSLSLGRAIRMAALSHVTVGPALY